MLPTVDQLRALFPRALSGYINALTNNADLLAEHGLDQALPLCHFLAQIAAETGGLTIVEERGSYSAARLRQIFPKHFTSGQAAAYAYKPQAILSRAYANRIGNGSEARGDGWKYRGRGPMQTTGKNNYRATGERLGVDLVANPDLLATDFTLGLKAALIEWSALNLGAIATQLGPTHAAVLKIARGINVGNVNSGVIPNGFIERKEWFAKIWAALSCTKKTALYPATDGILEEGERGEDVRKLQDLLAGCGYAVGKIDGIFGPRTADAVAAWMAREQLSGNSGKFKVEWFDRLENAPLHHDNAARADVTAADLRADGDDAAKSVNWLRRVAGSVAVFFGIGQAADQTGTLSGLRSVVEPLAGNLAWLASSKWVLGIIAALAVVAAASWIELQVVRKYREFRP